MNNLSNVCISLPCILCAICVFRVNTFFKAHPDNYRGTEYTEKAQNNLSNGIKSSVYYPCDLCIPCEHFFKAKYELKDQYLKETLLLAEFKLFGPSLKAAFENFPIFSRTNHF